MVFVVKDKKTETKFKEEKPIKFNKDVEYQLHTGLRSSSTTKQSQKSGRFKKLEQTF